MNVEDRIRGFIVEDLRFTGSPVELTYDYPLIDRGVLDSIGILQLVDHLEADYGIVVEEDDIVVENFGTIAGIASMIDARRSG
jgi:acyl carrier protein